MSAEYSTTHQHIGDGRRTKTMAMMAAAEEVSLVRSLDNFGFIGLGSARVFLFWLVVPTLGVWQAVCDEKRISGKRETLSPSECAFFLVVPILQDFLFWFALKNIEVWEDYATEEKAEEYRWQGFAKP